MMTNQIVAVSPLKVFLHCAVIQTDPGVVMTQTWKNHQHHISIRLNCLFVKTLMSTTNTTNTQTHTLLCLFLVVCSACYNSKTHTNRQKYIRTINKLLLSSGDDTTEVGTVLSAVFFCILPGVSVGEVPVRQHSVSGYENT